MLRIITENKIILIVVVLIIAAFAWFGMTEQGPSSGLLVNESRTDSSPLEQDILRTLLDMRSIELNSALFENPAFMSLRDFGREIVPEPVGRTNPFAPVEAFIQPTQEDAAADEVIFGQ